jgi:hypothetical protein
MHETDIEELTSRPATYFSSPMAIVDSEKLELTAKLIALRQWEFEVRQLEVATEENMNAVSKTTLQDVHEAMRALGHEPESDPVPGGKAS